MESGVGSLEWESVGGVLGGESGVGVWRGSLEEGVWRVESRVGSLWRWSQEGKSGVNGWL